MKIELTMLCGSFISKWREKGVVPPIFYVYVRRAKGRVNLSKGHGAGTWCRDKIADM